MNKWTKANKTMQKILRGRVMFSKEAEKLFENREYLYLLDVVVHAYQQIGEDIEVSAEWWFLNEKGKKVVETGNVVIGD